MDPPLRDVISGAWRVADVNESRDDAFERIVCRMILSAYGISPARVTRDTQPVDGVALSIARITGMIDLPFRIGLQRLTNPHELFEIAVQPKSKAGLSVSRFWKSYVSLADEMEIDWRTEWFIMVVPMSGPGVLAIHNAKFALDIDVLKFRMSVRIDKSTAVAVEPFKQVLVACAACDPDRVPEE